MLLGGCVKKSIAKVKKIPYVLLVFGVLFSGILWAGEYAIIMFFGKGYIFQFVITISRMLFAFCILTLALKLDDERPIALGDRNFVNYIADSTLEIYLIQVIAKGIIQNHVIEPWNMLVFWLVALLGGIAIHSINNFALSKCK